MHSSRTDDPDIAVQRSGQALQILDYLAEWRDVLSMAPSKLQQTCTFSGDSRRSFERYGHDIPEDMVSQVDILSETPKSVRLEMRYDSGRRVIYTFHGDTSQLNVVDHKPASNESVHRHNDLGDYERLKRALFMCNPDREVTGRTVMTTNT